MGLDLQTQGSYAELEEHPYKDEIIALLSDDFSEVLLGSISNGGKRATMGQLERKLSYDIDSLLKDEKLIFSLGGQPVGYVRIEHEEENTINLTTLMTSNNNNNIREIPLPKHMDMSLDNKYLIIGKKLPYLGTTMIKILIEKFCSKEGIECINIVSAEGADEFYEKTLNFLGAEGIIADFEQNENAFTIII